MRVQTIRSTDEPEKLACQAGRGDYYDGYIADVGYDELMETVEYDETHVDCVEEIAESYRVDPDSPEDGFIDFGSSGKVFRDGSELYPSPETAYRQMALLEEFTSSRHWGVFEHPQITLAIEGISVACERQLTRHRHVSFDVQSQRYVNFTEKEDPVRTPLSLRDGQSITRDEGVVDLDEETRERVESLYRSETDSAFEAYEILVENGVPKEEARDVLPIGTEVNLTASMNARTLLHVVNLRSKANAQTEIRDLTDLILDEFEAWMPMTSYLWNERVPFDISP